MYWNEQVRMRLTAEAQVLIKGLLAQKKYDAYSSTDKNNILGPSKIKLRFPKTCCIGVFGIAALICLIVAIVHFNASQTIKDEPPDPEVPLPPSPSILRKFSNAAVCSDGAPCSEIGRDILKKNGSAVDAAIATLFCNGVVNCHSMGLGGGFLMLVYNRSSRSSHTINAREMAPLAATEEMFRTDPNLAREGPLAVGVPGELLGYWAAYRRYGRLPWSELVEPTLKICRDGYNMTKHQYDALSFRPNNIYKDEILREIFVDPNTGKFYPQGSRIVQKQICKTLEIISKVGGEALYKGILAESLVEDIQEMGGIITLEDLKKYNVLWTQSFPVKLRDGVELYSATVPGSGPILSLILNILNGYNFTKESIATTEDAVLTYHRMIEAFKFAFARRSEIGDPLFVNLKEVDSRLSSEWFADSLRSKIKDDTTFNDPQHYGAVYTNQDDHGTAHVSVLAPNGDAVSVTSTINLYFGAGITSKRTGIILNSGMDDFSSKYFTNYFDLPMSVANKLEPGKKPLSSMSPSILVDSKGDVIMVIGAAGGTKIISAVASVIMRNLWLGDDLKVAVDAPRFHHQLFPNILSYEYGTLKEIVSGLKKLGHKVSRFRQRSSVVCAITKSNGTIFANADYRKGGDVHGF